MKSRIAAVFGVVVVAFVTTAAVAAAPKFFFQIVEVKAGPGVDEATKTFAREAVQADLASRPEWASDVQAATPDALVAELQKRKLRGFSVTVRFEDFKKDVKEPAEGARRKRVAVDVRLSVFGTTIPDAKLAFSGEGESATESEVADKAIEAEGASLAKDAIKDAVKQAVDQAVMKLSIGKSAPMNEAKHKKKK